MKVFCNLDIILLSMFKTPANKYFSDSGKTICSLSSLSISSSLKVFAYFYSFLLLKTTKTWL
jgi:hypothetical protein